MIKMTYQQATSQQFVTAFQRLAGTQFSAQVAYKIKKLADHITRAKKQIAVEYEALVNQYAKKDEHGNLVKPEGGMGFDVEESKQEEFIKAQEEFGKKEFTLEYEPFYLYEFGNAQFTAADLSFLEPIWQEAPEMVPGASNNVVNL